MKRRILAHRRSVTATGGGTGGEVLTPFNQRVVAIVGDTALTGVVGTHEGDTDHPQGKCVKLTQAVLESQEGIVRVICGISDRLDQIINVLGDICKAINALKT